MAVYWNMTSTDTTTWENGNVQPTAMPIVHKFHVGQQVICVNATHQSLGLKNGNKYTIHSFIPSTNGNDDRIVLEEITLPVSHSGFRKSRFKPA